MDNFRHHNNKFSRPSITDGFLPPKSKSPRPKLAKSADLAANPSGSPQRKLLDDFSRQSDFGAKTRAPSIVPDGTSIGRRPIYKANSESPLPSPEPLGKKHRHSARGALRLASKSLSMILILGLVGGGYLFGKGYLQAKHIFKGGARAAALSDEIDPNKLKGEGDGRINILLLGKGGPGHEGPDLTDTLMIASIDPVQKDAALLSIPRDLWVEGANGYGGNKINAVYATAKQNALYKRQSAGQAEKAGIQAAEKKMTEVTGVPLHYYAMVDFEAFRKAIDTVGGVTINAPEALIDPTVAWENNWSATLATKGLNNFNGKQALLYARSRHGSARGDFDRAERQRLVLVALRQKAFSLGTFSNPLKVAQLIDAFGDHVQTDISLDDMKQMYNLAKTIDGSKVQSVGLADPPNDYVTTGNYQGQSIVQPKAGLFEYGPIQNYLRSNAFKDGFIRKENPRIMILNGTGTAGLATKRADELKSYGYNVIKVDDAPTKAYTSTMFINLRGDQKKYTKHYLELRLKTTATSKLPAGINPELADFVIIVGSNETYNSQN